MATLSRLADGTELVVHDPPREAAVRHLVAALSRVRAAAVDLMVLYLRSSFRAEVFWLDTVEVFAQQSAEGEDAVLSFSYSPDEDPEAEGYTRFDVLVRIDDEAIRPVRFAIGFH